jgi:hypothetical protein
MGADLAAILRNPWRTEIYLKVLEAAIEGRTLFYSDLPGGRFHWGKYLYRISGEEARQHRPPLTAIVVEKRTGRPAEGFLNSMRDIEYPMAEGESDEDVWRRASAEVFAYWRRT